MIGDPGSSGVPILRSPTASEADAIQAVWEASHNADDPGGRPRGGWSVDPWSTSLSVLELDERIVGVAAIRAEAETAEAVSARVALDLDERRPDLAEVLIRACIDLACAARGERVRLFVPKRAEWATRAAQKAGFEAVRSIQHMLLPATTPLPVVHGVRNVSVRAIRDGEDQAVLDALNRNWAGTWDFVPIRLELLASDLVGQREGMLLAVPADDDTRILATCHAVFDPTETNPDGQPRGWISNLTVDPEQRGLGLGRAMLVAGLESLRTRGAGLITLGVDAGDPAPLRLYQSVGFEAVSTLQAWDRSLQA